MDGRVKRFFDELLGKKVIFCGIGVSNTPLIHKFLEKGAIVTACDSHTRDELGAVADELENAGAALKLGKDYLQDLDGDVIFRTPGMKFHLPELEEARKRGIAVTSEMELFFELCPAKIFAVTGSDGKTTTTTLISEMLKAEGYRVHLGGNIGRALLPLVEEIEPEDMAVVELSSFQLISMRQSPQIAVVTNVAPNHLDIHKDMEEYINAKKNILLHQGALSRTVLNLDNSMTKEMAGLTRGQTFFFSRKSEPAAGAFMDAHNTIYMNLFGEKIKIMTRDDIRLCGDHNVENYLAAISAVWGYVSMENLIKIAREFGGVEHRMEFVRELDGIKWYNDSIATNPTRTIAGLNSFLQKILLIAGGYDKHIPFTPLVPVLLEKVKVLILMGNTADIIESEVKNHPLYGKVGILVIRATDMAEAVSLAKSHAKDGDIVSLSPACASFDMYKNFEVRGNHYKDIVKSL